MPRSVRPVYALASQPQFSAMRQPLVASDLLNATSACTGATQRVSQCCAQA